MIREKDNQIENTQGYFHSEYISVFYKKLLSNSIWVSIEQSIESLLRFATNGSGWIFQSVDEIVIKVLCTIPVQKQLGGSFIELPKSLVRNIFKNLSMSLLNSLYDNIIKKLDHINQKYEGIKDRIKMTEFVIWKGVARE